MDKIVKIFCKSEPDISYTRNRKLEKGQHYYGIYTESNLSSYGICEIYDVYDLNKNKLGQYFAIDFETVEVYRDRILSEILG